MNDLDPPQDDEFGQTPNEDEKPTDPVQKHEVHVWHNGRIVYRHSSDLPVVFFDDVAIPFTTDKSE
jgi:hypothetical protein